MAFVFFSCSDGLSGHDPFHELSFLIQHTAAGVILQQHAFLLQRQEQRRLQRRPQGGVPHVDIGIGGEWTWFGSAVAVDVEEAPARGHASAGGFLIAGECDVHHFWMFLPKAQDLLVQVFPVRVVRSQLPAFLGDRHKFHEDHRFAAAVRQALQEAAGGDLFQVFGCNGDRSAEDQPAPVQFIHVGNQPVIDAFAAPGVGDLTFALDAHNGQKVAAPVKQPEILFIHEGAVGEDREQNPRLFARRFNDIPPQQRFAAGQQNEADAHIIGFVKEAQPFLAGQLPDRRRVHRGMVAPGIAARAMQIALAGDTGDEERGNVLPGVLRPAALFARRFAGGGKPRHIDAFAGIFQRRPDGVPDHPFHAAGHVFLNIKSALTHVYTFIRTEPRSG